MSNASFDDVQKTSRESLDLAQKSFGSVSKGLQAVAVEVADYSKKALEDTAAHFERLLGTRSLDKAVEVQSQFVKSSYETYVARLTKIGEIYAGIAKESYRPVENAASSVR